MIKSWTTKMIAIAMSCLFLLTGFVDLLSAGKRYPHDFKQEYLLLGALERSQGITTDGEYYYFSWKKGLLKTDLEGNTVKRNFLAIPEELQEQYNLGHIGGISYYNGKIYAGLEDSKVFNYPTVAVYDAETLKYTGEYHVLDKDIQAKGLPWVAVDSEKGLLYAAQRDHAPCIVCYDINTFEMVKKIELSETVHKIQGGEVYDGRLYVASNYSEEQSVYAIELETGKVEKLFDRNLTKLSEGEGLTIIEKNGEMYLVIMDMGSLFINANLRYFKIGR